MLQIAIDGPGGAGKSSIARRIAKDLEYLYVDTGALYRAIGLYAARLGLQPHDADKIIPHLPDMDVSLAYDADGVQQVYLNGENVSDAIRENRISAYASAVSAVGAVRSFLLQTQRGRAQTNNVIMDGRDIGTVILPDAQVKIFLTAEDTVRAKRRMLELEQKGEHVALEEILEQIRKRDLADSTRKIAPLKPAPDAVTLDCTALDFEQSVAAVKRIIAEKLAAPDPSRNVQEKR